MSDAQAIAKDLRADNVIIVGTKNGADSDPVVAYTNEFKGKKYFHIRTVWQGKDGWTAGKGLAVDAANAKTLLTALGKAAASF